MGEDTITEEPTVDDERCPGCRGLIIDGICPFCTSPIPGLSTPVTEEAEAPIEPPEPPVAAAPRIVVTVLASLAGLYWLGIGAWVMSVAIGNRPGSAGFFVLGFALVSLVVGVYGSRAAWSTMRQSYTAQGQLVFAAFLGITWAVLFSLISESWLFAVAIPVHLVIGVFALVGSRFFERAFY